jgi:hypothetical protein
MTAYAGHSHLVVIFIRQSCEQPRTKYPSGNRVTIHRVKPTPQPFTMAITKVITVPTDLPHARLYLEDIEEICRILLEFQGGERAGRYVDPASEAPRARFLMEGLSLDTTEDLKEYGGSATDITVQVGSGLAACQLEFRLLSSPVLRLYSSSTERGFATYGKVRAILERRELTVRNITAKMPGWLAFVFLYVVVYGGAFAFAKLSPGHRMVPAVLSAGILVWVLYFGLRPSRVYFVRSHESSRSRSQKTRDYIEKIAFLIVGTVIGVVISKLLSR